MLCGLSGMGAIDGAAAIHIGLRRGRDPSHAVVYFKLLLRA
jgi:hypothetical protein